MKCVQTLMMTAAALVVFSTTLQAGGEGWTSDFEAAKAQAAKENKDLLVDFTGSDWCGWCIKLKEEVFVHDAFKQGVQDTFVLVELDYPRDKTKLSEEVQKQNARLKEAYPVRGFPTILLCDAQGLPYAQTGYQAGGPENYVKHLNELREVRMKRDNAMADVRSSEGVQKAKAIVAYIETLKLNEALVEAQYGDMMKTITELDPQDETGYVKEKTARERFAGINKEINGFARKKDFQGGVSYLDGLLKDDGFEPLQKQQILMVRSMMLMELDQVEEALKSIDTAIATHPDSPMNERIRQYRTKLAAEWEKDKAGQNKQEDKPAEAKPAQ